MALHAPLVGLPPKKYRKQFSRNAGKDKFEESPHEIRDMVLASVDEAVHKVIRALKTSGLYENSIILVTTDNGGGPWYSNTPLKGTKETLYEGGIRAASFLLSPLLQNTGFRYQGLLHLADWTPTLLSLAGVDDGPGDDSGVGLDVWDSLNNNQSISRMIIHNIDEEQSQGGWQASATRDKYKLIWGQDMLLKRIRKTPSTKVQLFDVLKDPTESENIASIRSDVVQDMKNQIIKAKHESFEPADYPDLDKRGWPVNFDGIISSGWCESH